MSILGGLSSILGGLSSIFKGLGVKINISAVLILAQLLSFPAANVNGVQRSFTSFPFSAKSSHFEGDKRRRREIVTKATGFEAGLHDELDRVDCTEIDM